jgi:TadE-like protein
VSGRRRGEEGQTLVEFGILLTALLILTVGLADVGVAFFRYNAVSAAARYGARWGGVVGGTCGNDVAASQSSTDWCEQLGAQTTGTNFWSEDGNRPLQSNHQDCPSDITTSFDGYYSDSNSTPSQQVSYYLGSTATTIVGAVVQRIDTDSNGTVFKGAFLPGLNTSLLKVCIQLPYDAVQRAYATGPGSRVRVYVYYPYKGFTSFFRINQFNINASSTYGIE